MAVYTYSCNLASFVANSNIFSSSFSLNFARVAFNKAFLYSDCEIVPTFISFGLINTLFLIPDLLKAAFAYVGSFAKVDSGFLSNVNAK